MYAWRSSVRERHWQTPWDLDRARVLKAAYAGTSGGPRRSRYPGQTRSHPRDRAMRVAGAGGEPGQVRLVLGRRYGVAKSTLLRVTRHRRTTGHTPWLAQIKEFNAKVCAFIDGWKGRLPSIRVDQVRRLDPQESQPSTTPTTDHDEAVDRQLSDAGFDAFEDPLGGGA
jgi:hypothetical protein